MFDHEPVRVLPPLRARLLLWTIAGSVVVGLPLMWGLAWVLDRLGLIEGPMAPIEVHYEPLGDPED